LVNNNNSFGIGFFLLIWLPKGENLAVAIPLYEIDRLELNANGALTPRRVSQGLDLDGRLWTHLLRAGFPLQSVEAHGRQRLVASTASQLRARLRDYESALHEDDDEKENESEGREGVVRDLVVAVEAASELEAALGRR
jgi:hypothetical protein